MANRPTILILTASAGTGHNIAARAVEHALRAELPDADIEVVDVLAISNPAYRRLYAGGYMGLVRYAPSAMGWLYDAMDRPGRRLYNAIRILIQDLNKLPTTRYVRQRRPDLIINTHYLPAEIIAQMRRARQIDCPQATVTTDYETHRLWAQDPTERYYTATPLGKAYLTKWGVDSDRVLVTGIPIRPAFSKPLTRPDARAACGLDRHRPVVLLMCTGINSGVGQELFAELLALPADVQVVAIAGRNTRMQRRLTVLVERGDRTARVLGYTDQMHVWMRAADLAISKPGGLTVAEALVLQTPLVIINPIPGQETRNSDYLLEQGAAIKVNNPRLLAHRVHELLDDDARLTVLRTAAGRIARPSAAIDIAHDAQRLLGLRADAVSPASTA